MTGRKTAQIWNSIEELYGQAEKLQKNNGLNKVCLKSVPPPLVMPEHKIMEKKRVVLKSKPVPQSACLVESNKDKITSVDLPTPITSIKEIAAAVERANRSLKTPLNNNAPEQISDQFRQEIIKEIENTIKVVLAQELPTLVRYAVSVSIHEVITTLKKERGNQTSPSKTKSSKKTKIKTTTKEASVKEPRPKKPSSKIVRKKI